MKKNNLKKNIFFVVPTLTGGGAERVVSVIASELSKKHYVSLITFYNSDSEYDLDRKVNIIKFSEKPQSNIFFKFTKAIKRILKLRKIIKNNPNSTFISFLTGCNLYVIVSSLFIVKNKPKIIVSERNNPQRQNFIHRILIRILYRFVDKIVSCSKGIQCILKKDFKLNSITIYNPTREIKNIDKQIKFVTKKFSYIFSKYDKKFLFVGRLSRQKNLPFMFYSFKKYLEKHDENACLILVGDGSLKNNLMKLVHDIGIKNRVFFLGRQNNIDGFMQLSDVLLLTSLWEGMPNVLLEAVANNLPIISTDCDTGPREILTEIEIGEIIQYPFISTDGLLTDFSVKEDDKNFDKKTSTFSCFLFKFDNSKKGHYQNKFNNSEIIIDWDNLI